MEMSVEGNHNYKSQLIPRNSSSLGSLSREGATVWENMYSSQVSSRYTWTK